MGLPGPPSTHWRLFTVGSQAVTPFQGQIRAVHPGSEPLLAPAPRGGDAPRPPSSPLLCADQPCRPPTAKLIPSLRRPAQLFSRHQQAPPSRLCLLASSAQKSCPSRPRTVTVGPSACFAWVCVFILSAIRHLIWIIKTYSLSPSLERGLLRTGSFPFHFMLSTQYLEYLGGAHGKPVETMNNGTEVRTCCSLQSWQQADFPPGYMTLT